MPSHLRELTVLGLLGATLWLPQCSQLTKVDWTLIPPPGGAGGSAGVSGAPAGGAAVGAGEGGESGALGAAGEAGEGGAAGEVEGGGAAPGSSGGAGGGGAGGSTAGAGSGGTAGSAGASGSGGTAGGSTIVHTTCEQAPPTPTTTPDLSGKVVFFDGGSSANGNRTNGSPTAREGLDKACATAKATLQLPGSEVHAVISISPTDEIFDMPALYHLPTRVPLVSPLGIQVAKDWITLWQTGISASLVCTGVMPVGVRAWISGTGTVLQAISPDPTVPGIYGTYAGIVGGENDTCDGWTSGMQNNAVRAQSGSTIADNDVAKPPYFFARFATSCDTANGNVLCATYDP